MHYTTSPELHQVEMGIGNRQLTVHDISPKCQSQIVFAADC